MKTKAKEREPLPLCKISFSLNIFFFGYNRGTPDWSDYGILKFTSNSKDLFLGKAQT